MGGLERVRVTLPVAGVGYRTLAYLLDALLLFFAGTAGYFILSLLADVVGAFQALSTLLQVLVVVGLFAALWVYWTACETLWRGQTMGKRLLGIRVVRVDGSPVGLYESAVRNLLRVVDFLPAMYGLGVLSLLLTEQHRRLGDLVAGTLLVRQERIALEKYVSPAPSGPIAVPANAPLPPGEVELILQFLERAAQLDEGPRERLTRALLARCASGLSAPELEAAAREPERAQALLRALATGGAWPSP